MTWRVRGRHAGKDAQGNDRYYLQTQDRVILDLIKNNQWKRPIYFAISTSPESRLFLQNYFQHEGQAYLITPKKMKNNNEQIYINKDVFNKRLEKFQFRNWNKPNHYYDENIRRMLTSYHYTFVQYARFLINQNQPEEAIDWLKFAEEKIYLPKDDPNSTLLFINYAYFYTKTEDTTKAIEAVEILKKDIIDKTQKWAQERQKKVSYYNDLFSQTSDARKEADFNRVRSLRNKLSQSQKDIQNHTQILQQYHSIFVVLQWIYYQLNKEQQATSLVDEVKLLSEQIIKLPTTKEESEILFKQTGLGTRY